MVHGDIIFVLIKTTVVIISKLSELAQAFAKRANPLGKGLWHFVALISLIKFGFLTEVFNAHKACHIREILEVPLGHSSLRCTTLGLLVVL